MISEIGRKHIGILCLCAIVGVAVASILTKSPGPDRVRGINISTATTSAQAASEMGSAAQTIKVDVSGAVINPGVISLHEGDRVQDAILAAGGFREDADADFVAASINLAEKASDGGKIFIPSRQQAQAALATPTNSAIRAATTAPSGKVSINRATMSQLDSLPGIGETYAQRIIANRPYSSVEQLCTKAIFRSKSTCDKILPLVSL
jgi:competence protein ComEA